MFKNLFNPENSFWEFMTNISQVLFVGFLWLLCCIPIITIGASTSALYDYIFKVAKNKEAYVIGSFFRAFKDHFIKATLLWAMMIIWTGFLLVDAFICLQIGTSISKVIFFAILAVGLFSLIMYLYLFPVLAYFGRSIKETIKKSFILGVGHLPITLIIGLIFTIAGLIVYSSPFLVLVIPSFSVYVSAFFYINVFQKPVNI